MKYLLPFAIAAGLGIGASAHAASSSQIGATIDITLRDILIGGTRASEFFDYEADGGLEVFDDFSESFALGGIGATSGGSSAALNGTTVDPDLGADPLQIGDTLTLSLDSQATADSGFVNRDQREFAAFSFYNYTDQGGGYETLSFVFDYALTYTTMLHNDIAGNQAIGAIFLLVELDDGATQSSLDLFPQNTPDRLEELYFGGGTITPGGTRSGSFSLDLVEGYGYFTILATASTPTYINTVPVPGAAVLLSSTLIGLLLGCSRRNPCSSAS